MEYSEITLASTSPRRQEILGNTGIKFRAEASAYEEDMTLDMHEHELVRFLAEGKAAEVAERFPDALVIGGDTFIVHDGEFLGKPKTTEEAVAMLERLSDESLEVVSGVAIMQCSSGFKKTFHESTYITFRPVPREAIDAYVATKIPFDRAGAFGIQDMGGRFIKELRGDYFNVLGFPLFRVLDELYDIDPTLMTT